MAINKGIVGIGESSTPFVPDENFNTVLYTGSGGSQNIDTVGFQPDFTWIKQRNDTNPHSIFDSVRGAGKLLSSQTTSAQGGNAGDLLGSFRPLGFQVNRTYLSSNFDNTNLSGATYVAWSWKAGGAAVSNTDGTVTSQVSANVDAGFSIVNYNGSTSGATVGHGLNSTPEVIIIKCTSNGSTNWISYHQPIGDDYYLTLNSNIAKANFSNWLQPNSTTFALNQTFGNANTSGRDYIAYAFHSVDGYSKMGSYDGNNGSNPITTGFRPAFLMIKRSNTSGSWLILDNKRETSNPRHTYLFPASGSAESVVASNLGYDVDFDDNGFELKSNGGDVNASGSEYIFMAFAE